MLKWLTTWTERGSDRLTIDEANAQAVANWWNGFRSGLVVGLMTAAAVGVAVRLLGLM